MADTGHILIVDDHALIREGLAVAIRAGAPHLSIESTDSIAGALNILHSGRHYQLVLLDLLLPDANGFMGLVELQKKLPHTAIAILSGKQNHDTVSMAREMGAAGYLLKSQPLDEMVAAIHRLLAGERIFPATASVTGDVSEARERLALLSTAQRRVLLALANGRLNKQIADDLGVTEATIKAHVSAILRKLKVHNRTQAILAMRPLLGDVGDPT